MITNPKLTDLLSVRNEVVCRGGQWLADSLEFNLGELLTREFAARQHPISWRRVLEAVVRQESVMQTHLLNKMSELIVPDPYLTPAG